MLLKTELNCELAIYDESCIEYIDTPTRVQILDETDCISHSTSIAVAYCAYGKHGSGLSLPSIWDMYANSPEVRSNN